MTGSPSPSLRAAHEAIALARRRAPSAEVLVRARARRSGHLRFARGEATSAGDVEETTVTVDVAFGRRHAATTVNQTEPESLGAAVDRAIAMARLAPEDVERMPALPAQAYAVVPRAIDEATWSQGAADRARAAAEAVAGAPAPLVTAGFYESEGGETYVVTSAGLEARHASTRASFTVTVRTADGTGSGWAGATSHRAADVDAAAAARVAADKARQSASPRSLDPGRYTVVLEPAAVADLLGFLVEGLDARRADEGRSFFSRPGGGNRIGEKIFGDIATLVSDPTDPAMPGAPFDAEGFPLRPTTWIERGTLVALPTSRWWAARKGTAPTGRHGTWRLEGGEAPGAGDLVAGVDRGLLVTRFWYTRWLDPQALLVTGLTRDGLFLIEGGRVTSPVRNFRWNESPVTMLRNADAMTRALARVPGGWGLWRVPAVRTRDFEMASASAAV